MVKGTKRALLVGCQYYDTFYEKDGCGNDLQIIQDLIEEKLYFKQDKIKILLESKSPESQSQPTKSNIQKELKKMMHDAKEGDVLFFYFSGLGKLDENNNGPPAFISSKLERFTADEFRSIINQRPLPSGASFTLVCDANYSGRFLDPPEQPAQNRIMFSSCKANEISHRRSEDGNTNGVFTEAIQAAFDDLQSPVTNIDLFKYATKHVKEPVQHPCFVCNKKNEVKPFLGYLITSSMN